MNHPCGYKILEYGITAFCHHAAIETDKPFSLHQEDGSSDSSIFLGLLYAGAARLLKTAI